MNIYICSIVTFAYYYKTIQTFYTSTGILFSYISVLSFVFSLYSDYFLAGSGGLLTGVLEYSGVNDTEATRSYRAQADNKTDGKTTDYKPKQQNVLFRCCSFSRLGTVNHDASKYAWRRSIVLMQWKLSISTAAVNSYDNNDINIVDTYNIPSIRISVHITATEYLSFSTSRSHSSPYIIDSVFL